MQGNGMGPVIWLALSVLLITIMQAEGHYASFSAAISLSILQMCCFMFVDDTDLIQTTSDVNTSAIQGLQRMQAALDCWAGCLQVTGGNIKPSKSFWYLIDWKWTGQNWKYLNSEEAPGELFITTETGERITLARYEPSQSNPTLGLHLAMDGNQKGHKSYLRKEAENFADRLRTSAGLEKNDAWTGIVT